MDSRNCQAAKARETVESKIVCNWRWPKSGKENTNPSLTIKDVFTSNRADAALREVKANASKTLTNVKSTIDNISQKLRRSTRKKNNLSGLQYREMENNQATPVKLYSPFGFVTPSPHKEALITPRKRRLTPKRFMFVSPTGKLKKDIEDLSSGIQELHTVAKSINKKRNKKLY